jgi:hypothetical protein
MTHRDFEVIARVVAWLTEDGAAGYRQSRY